jgi:hypothetical protein
MATDDVLTTVTSEFFKAEGTVRATHNTVKQKHTWKVTQEVLVHNNTLIHTWQKLKRWVGTMAFRR